MEKIATPVPKIFGLGLNKTGTSTLGAMLKAFGFNHAPYRRDLVRAWHRRDYDKVWNSIERHDSFEDWPYSLMYPMLSERYPDARFILTRRSSPERWLSSFKKHALTSTPFRNVRKMVFGRYYPFGSDADLIRFYSDHNARVRETISGRAFLELCWEEGDGVEKLARFLDVDIPGGLSLPRVNASADRSRKFVLANRVFASVFAPAAWDDIWQLKL